MLEQGLLTTTYRPPGSVRIGSPPSHRECCPLCVGFPSRRTRVKRLRHLTPVRCLIFVPLQRLNSWCGFLATQQIYYWATYGSPIFAVLAVSTHLRIARRREGRLHDGGGGAGRGAKNLRPDLQLGRHRPELGRNVDRRRALLCAAHGRLSFLGFVGLTK